MTIASGTGLEAPLSPLSPHSLPPPFASSLASQLDSTDNIFVTKPTALEQMVGSEVSEKVGSEKIVDGPSILVHIPESDADSAANGLLTAQGGATLTAPGEPRTRSAPPALQPARLPSSPRSWADPRRHLGALGRLFGGGGRHQAPPAYDAASSLKRTPSAQSGVL